jgi:hypothetical protein
VIDAPIARAQAPGAADPVTDELLQAVAQEITLAFASKKRFTPLPPALDQAYFSSVDVPFFTLSGSGGQTDQPALDRLLAQLAIPWEGFRLVGAGRIIGRGPTGEWVVACSGGSEGTIIGQGTSRKIILPPQCRLALACFVNDNWVYLTSKGLITDGAAAPWPDSARFADSSLIVSDDSELVAIRMLSTEQSPNRTPSLLVGMGNESNWRTQLYENIPLGNLTGVIRCKDGGLVAIGSKIARLRKNFKAIPSESELDAVFQAAKAGDYDTLVKLAADVTLYPGTSLRGLETVLRELGGQKPYGKELEGIIRETERRLLALQQRAAQPDEEELADKLKPVLEEYLEQTRNTLAECQKAGSGPLPVSYQRLGHLFAMGYQYYEGFWIYQPCVMLQEDLSEAIIQARLYDVETDRVLSTLFRIDETGRLHLLYMPESVKTAFGAEESADSSQPAPPPRPASIESSNLVRDQAGQLLVKIHDQGLARLDGGKLTWLDQSPQMKCVGRLEGCDRNGRLYFGMTDVSSDGGTAGRRWWVYQAGGEPEKNVPVTDYPCEPSPVMDDLGRVWFVSPPARQQGTSAGAGPVNLALAQARPHHLRFASEADPAGLFGDSGPRGSGQESVLYCLDTNNTLHRYLSLPYHYGGSQCQLLAGSGGSMMLFVPQRTLLISDDIIYKGADLHDLAKRYFDQLLAASPTKAASSLAAGPMGLRPKGERGSTAWLRCGDILWIASSGRVEAYRQGQPLSIDTRLKLLTAGMEQPCVLGPLGSAEKKSVLISPFRFNLSRCVWAVQGPKGINLEPIRPSASTQDQFLQSEQCNALLVDHDGGWIYGFTPGSYGRDALWRTSGPGIIERLSGEGNPVMLLGKHGLLLRCSGSGRPPYQIWNQESTSDLMIAYMKPLAPVHLEKDDSILCLTPEGLAWIAPDEKGVFRITRSISVLIPGSLATFIGRTPKAVYLQNHYAAAGGTRLLVIPVE